jgi:hypothetical protein
LIGRSDRALKFRYLINFDPSRADKDKDRDKEASSALKKKHVGFDAKTIARKEEGWMDMLERAVGKWVEVVAAEKREETGVGA